MFGWFKQKTPELSPEIKSLFDKIIGPQALATAIAECVGDYSKAVKNGRIQFPAHRRKNKSVESVWADVRLEAFWRMLGFGQANLLLLSEFRRQHELLTTYLDERPHLEMPQPRGELIADTWQGVWQLYLYLDAVGSEVMDRETDRDTLKQQGRTVISDFTMSATALRDRWREFDLAVRTSSSLPDMPPTAIELLWEDVTAKSKSIALTTIFGPQFEDGMAYMVKLVEEEGFAEVVALKRGFDRVRAAKQPEDIREVNS